MDRRNSMIENRAAKEERNENGGKKLLSLLFPLTVRLNFSIEQVEKVELE